MFNPEGTVIDWHIVIAWLGKYSICDINYPSVNLKLNTKPNSLNRLEETCSHIGAVCCCPWCLNEGNKPHRRQVYMAEGIQEARKLFPMAKLHYNCNICIFKIGSCQECLRASIGETRQVKNSRQIPIRR